MPKRLVLVRHAKSSWARADLSDHQRPLKKRGIRTAPEVATELANRGWAPDVVVCSTAVRALQTWELMAPRLPSDVVLFEDADLYMGGIHQILDALRALSDDHETAWVIGHNPGWEDAARRLCGFDGPIRTADSVAMSTERATWASAIADTWTYKDYLLARSVDPKQSGPS